jgi:hypothetical protein
VRRTIREIVNQPRLDRAKCGAPLVGRAATAASSASAAALAQGQLPADLATSNPALQALLDRLEV